MSPRDGDGPDEPGERPASDVDAAWAEIVARWDAGVPGDGGAEPSAPRWPAEGGTESGRGGEDAAEGAAGAPGALPAPPPTARAPGPRDHVVPDRDAAEDGWVPPEAPPLPRASAWSWLPWAGVVGGPVLLLVAVLVGLPLPGLVLGVVAAAFSGGSVLLLLRLPSRRDDDDDDGAVV